MEPQEPDWLELEDTADVVEGIIEQREEMMRLFHEEYVRMNEEDG